MALKNRRKRTRNILTLAVSSAIMIWYVMGLGLDRYLPVADGISTVASATPDNSSSEIQVKRYDKEGNLHYRISASQADYFEAASAIQQDSPLYEDFNDADFGGETPYNTDTDYLRLVDPVFDVYQQGELSTALVSRVAYLTDSGDKAELIGDVKVNDLGAATQMNTRTLTLNMALQQILTQNPVTIETPSSTTQATGMQGNLTDQRWQLLSEVRSVIQP